MTKNIKANKKLNLKSISLNRYYLKNIVQLQVEIEYKPSKVIENREDFQFRRIAGQNYTKKTGF